MRQQRFRGSRSEKQDHAVPGAVRLWQLAYSVPEPCLTTSPPNFLLAVGIDEDLNSFWAENFREVFVSCLGPSLLPLWATSHFGRVCLRHPCATAYAQNPSVQTPGVTSCDPDCVTFVPNRLEHLANTLLDVARGGPTARTGRGLLPHIPA